MTRRLRTLSWILALSCVSGVGRAEMLLSQTTLVIGSQTTATTFTASGPGTVTLQLSDLSWPERLAGLSCAIVTSTTVIARTALDVGTSSLRSMSFDVSGPGTFTAIVSGAAAVSNPLQLGAYSLQIDITPSAVPLPASGLLLGAAIAGGALLLRRRGKPRNIMVTA
jgi:hypothetical protein